MAVRDGRILQANGEMRRLLGLRSDSEIEGRRLEEIIPMDLDNRGGLYSALGRLLPGDVRSYEWELMIPGAVYIPVVIKATGLGGGVLLISVRDFTEGRERSIALLELEEQRRALLEATIFPVFCVDREYRILWCSSSFGSLVGERPGSVTGKPCHMILSGVDSSCPGCPAARAMRSKSTISISSCGSGNRFRASVSAFRGADGSPSGAVVMILDPPGSAGSATDGESSREAAETIPDGSVRAPGAAGGPPPGGAGHHDAPHAGVNLSEWLDTSVERLVSLLGHDVMVQAAHEPARVGVSPEHLMETFRSLALADYGTCLCEGEGIMVRVDHAILETPRHGIEPGKYVSVSLGSRSLLERAESRLFASSFYNHISAFPARSPGSAGVRPGAVFVSQAGDDRKFYQIMIPAHDPVWRDD